MKSIRQKWQKKAKAAKANLDAALTQVREAPQMALKKLSKEPDLARALAQKVLEKISEVRRSLGADETPRVGESRTQVKVKMKTAKQALKKARTTVKAKSTAKAKSATKTKRSNKMSRSGQAKGRRA